MLISYSWLKQFIPDLHVTPDELTTRLSTTLAEVEGYTDYRAVYDGVVVGKIVDLKPHPNADKLQLATVDIGKKEPLKIVCGASNITVGDYVPVATIGATLSQVDHKHDGELTIKRRTIRGIDSEGMLCSPRELGISNDHAGILILNNEPYKRVGESFTALARADDIIFEIENKALTHRPDTFSHVGMAREIAAAFGLSFKEPEYQQPQLQVQPGPMKVDIQNKQLCRRYSAVTVTGIHVQPSPLWLQFRLKYLGVRPINNIVDITNYVLLEQGQPLHAFDQNTLHGESIIVRTATPGESITTLDGKQRELTTEMLVIADERRPIAVAGIMGGASTEVTAHTESIVLESANFEHYNNRKTARQLGLQTEASIRFSKNQDTNQTVSALWQALTLLTEMNQPITVSELVDVYPQSRTSQTIQTDIGSIQNLISPSEQITQPEITQYFTRLGFEVDSSQKNLTVTIPTFRPDVTLPQDLVEEVVRLHGYDNLTPSLPARDLTPVSLNDHVAWKRQVKRLTTRLGFSEVYNYSFVGSELYRKSRLANELSLSLRNPIAPERAFIRPYLLPQLIENILTNQYLYDTVELFELGRVAYPQPEDLPVERYHLASISHSAKYNQPFFRFKGKVEMLLHLLRLPEVAFDYIDDTHSLYSLFAPDRGSIILSRGEVIGVMGELHPEIAHTYQFKQPVMGMELNADRLYALTNQAAGYQPISIHPQLTIDITAVLDRIASVDQITHTLTQAGSELLRKTTAIYTYTDDETLGMNKKAVTFRLYFQSDKKSLSKDEVVLDVENVKHVLIENFGAELR